jgi:glycosyltransferase involved in cell wall biosynthesis
VVIATNVGAVSEVVNDGSNGILLSSDDVVDECCQSLASLSTTPAKLASYSLAASKSMMGRTWDAAISELAQRLESFPHLAAVPPKRILSAEVFSN